MNIVELYEIYTLYPSVQTDTRKLKKGDLFFALKGPNFNANAFAETALANGAEYAIIDDAAYAHLARTILVEDTLQTLQALALYHRNQFNIPFIAITGSNGKTTTKELIHAALSAVYITYTTEGNLNNHIGVPLTILRIRKDAQMAIIEMGANHLGEIAGYCAYTLPTHGLITNCGKAHLEGFGSYENIKKGKGELYDHLRNNQGTAFAMWDYDYLRDMIKGIAQVVTYGTRDADTEGDVLSSEPFLQVRIGKGDSSYTINTQLVGSYNLPNILAAVALGQYFKVPELQVVSAIQAYAPSNSRSQLVEKNGNTIILDAYNANPSSMKAAIENFEQLSAGDKILALGAMAELGEESLEEHKNIIRLIQQSSWKEVILVGGDFLKLSSPFKTFENAVEAGKWLRSQAFTHAHILVKGSRSMQMEKVIE
ncbi:MAG: UDP-N-acetylmuramoyl-tripeptide--D-alanyl-D-alanine ligase [Flavitalea sp.]